MATGVVSTAPMDAETRRQLRRAVIASTVGTAIEWYDFFLYGTAAGLVFAKLYFPNSDPLVGTLQAFLTFFVGFLARPVGAAFFGHFGDRIGRKATLIATLLLMGIATFLIGFVPGYSAIGIWGAIILTALRFLQGVGVGGEWGGSVLMSMEWAHRTGRRGFFASWPQFGVPAGGFLASLMVLIFSAATGPNFVVWGWRIPFFLSIALVLVGLYIRMGILESPIFSKLMKEDRIERQPVAEAFRRNVKDIILSALVRTSEQAPFYIFTAFVFSYGTTVLGQSRNTLLYAVMFAYIVSFFTIPFFGHLSDRIGRKRMYMYGAITTGIFGFIYFALLDTKVPAWIVVAILVSLIPHDMQYGPQAALIAESFTGRIRYSGASLGYQLASITAGGPAPFIATWLFAAYKSGTAIAAYIAVCAVVTLVALAFMTDRTTADISAEYDEHVASGAGVRAATVHQ